MIFYHNFSVAKALTDLFPDIGLDIDKLNNCMLFFNNVFILFYKNY